MHHPTRFIRHHQAQTDLLIVAAVTLLAGCLSIHFEIRERIFGWLQLGEHYQLDELPGILLVFTCGLLWFSHRRHQDMRLEIGKRERVESQLAHLLEENRRMSQQVITVQEAERRNLARELHDELGQYMNAIKIDAVTLQNCVGADLPHDRKMLTMIIANVDHVYSVVNDMIRRLRPVGLDELGLTSAIEHCINGWRSRLPGVRFSFEVAEHFSDLNEAFNLTLYRIAQEALTNVYKHAGASAVKMTLTTVNADIVLSIADDGVGNTASTGESTNNQRQGLGLIGMRERLLACGGRLEISSTPRQGFRIAAYLPRTT
jgi:two-component system sensor histidine kinase UhpB